MAAAIGIKGHCAQCDMTFELKPWQLNAIAVDIPFDCTYCHCGLQLCASNSCVGFALSTSGRWCARA